MLTISNCCVSWIDVNILRLKQLKNLFSLWIIHTKLFISLHYYMKSTSYNFQIIPCDPVRINMLLIQIISLFGDLEHFVSSSCKDNWKRIKGIEDCQRRIIIQRLDFDLSDASTQIVNDLVVLLAAYVEIILEPFQTKNLWVCAHTKYSVIIFLDFFKLVCLNIELVNVHMVAISGYS